MGDISFVINNELPNRKQFDVDKNDLNICMNNVLKELGNSFKKCEEKTENQRVKTINEILTSEISYLKHLKMLKEHFMTPLKEHNLLTAIDYKMIFGNIDTIYNINEELLNQLKNNINDYAVAFLKLAPFLKIYSVYAYDYKRSIKLLEELRMINQDFQNFIDRQEIKVQMKLSSLLITPIQRIPRYRLLLKQVLDHTPSHYNDYNRIIDSLRKVENTAIHMNNLVEEQENTENMLRIQKSLQENYPCIIKVGRKFLKEGMLLKMSQKKKKYHPRYFILMSDILMYCKPTKTDPKIPNSLVCCCILPINKCKVSTLNKGLFSIQCQEEQLFLYSENEKESEGWIKALQEAVKYDLDCRRTLMKENSPRRPARKRRLTEYEPRNISPIILRLKRLKEDI